MGGKRRFLSSDWNCDRDRPVQFRADSRYRSCRDTKNRSQLSFQSGSFKRAWCTSMAPNIWSYLGFRTVCKRVCRARKRTRQVNLPAIREQRHGNTATVLPQTVSNHSNTVQPAWYGRPISQNSSLPFSPSPDNYSITFRS